MSNLFLERANIEDLLPHRGHSLYLDKAEVSDARATGFSTWGKSHPAVIGHFPGFLIVPGICLVEAAAQLAGLIIATTQNSVERIGLLAGIKKVLIKRPVLPGQVIKLDVTIKTHSQDFYAVTGSAALAENEIACFDLILALVDKNSISNNASTI